MGIAFVVLGLISHFGLQSTIYLDIDMTAATSPGQKPKPHMEIYRKTSEGHDQVRNETDDFPLSFRVEATQVEGHKPCPTASAANCISLETTQSKSTPFNSYKGR